jgi:hypothetical protein
MSDITGVIYFVRVMFVTPVSTRLICCFNDQKNEFIRIVLLFSLFANKMFSAN